MIESVFISDLHLHPDEHSIMERFDAFLKWAESSVKNIYILGDFFHAWCGDDSIDEWSREIAARLHDLTTRGINLYYMHGNRDFLLGNCFAKLAGWSVLTEPSIINLGEEKVLLVHGDRYCTKDIGHQRLRRLTRNKIFPFLFSKLSLNYRQKIVARLRYNSANKQNKPEDEMDVVPQAVIKHMCQFKTNTLIHGHTHKPGVSTYNHGGNELKRYVLSDWDDMPVLLCYDHTIGIYFMQI